MSDARPVRSRSSATRRAIVLLLLAASTVGCSSSRWAESFEPAVVYGNAGLVETAAAPAPAAGDAATVPIDVREIPWERMTDLLAEEDARLSEADEHPADWDVERLLAHRAKLLTGLQVRGDPARIEIVGRSSFRDIGSVRPLGSDRAEIEAQARAVGATEVVVATKYLGRVDTVVDRPVTTFGIGGSYSRGRYDRRVGMGTGTSWVPVRTEADQIGVVAFFIRRID